MQRLTLLTIGSLKFSWAKDACEDFIGRLKHSVHLEIVELPASKAREPEKQRAEECERLLSALEKRSGRVWVLDERGKQMTSVQFSQALHTSRDVGDSLIFILGGAFGLNDAVRSKAEKLVSLSAMTLPHELCRVVFLEQLYRAFEIGKGAGYHH